MNWNFDGIKIAVIGDHNLDIDYVGGYPGLMSREQDSLAVFESHDSDVRYSGGGAANIVETLADVKVGKIIPVGVWDTGNCQRSRMLAYRFNEKSISHDGMVSGLPTPAFIKYYRPSGAHIFRANVASEVMHYQVEDQLIAHIELLEGKVDLVIVADYDESGNGVITHPIREAIRHSLSCPKIGLSRTRCNKLFQYDYLILNQTELKRAINYHSVNSLKQNVRDLWDMTFPKNVIVTLEGEGAAWYTEIEKSHKPMTFHIPEFNEVVVLSVALTDNIDTCGCGDAFVALFAACLARGDDIEQAIKAGNTAGRAQARMLCGARNISIEHIEREWRELYG